MKLEVGMYVRTETGQIGKITNFDGSMARVDTDKFITYKNFNSEITKASFNIIDLIEYDDILKIIYEDKEYICKVVNAGGIRGVQLTSTLSVGLGIVEAGIKSIVTKEQFESMSYKVEG